MIDDERDRFDLRVRIAAHAFTPAMQSHGCRGEASYDWTETMVFYGTLGVYDGEHQYRWN
jgi:hypothetical protein